MLALPVPHNLHVISSTKHQGCPKSWWRASTKKGLISTNLMIMTQAIFHVHDKVVPNEVFDLGFMPSYLVKDLLIPLSLNCPKGDPPRRCQIETHLTNFWGFFHQRGLASNESCHSCQSQTPLELMHNEGSPPPQCLSLNAIPSFVFNRSTSVEEANETLS